MSVCRCICQDGKQTNTQSQDLQHKYGSNKQMQVNFLFVFKIHIVSEFVICTQNKSHMIPCMTQHTCPGSFHRMYCCRSGITA